MPKNYKEIFGNININPYLKSANKFLPKNKIKTLFIFESPPFPPPFQPISNKYNEKWSYFYNYESTGSDTLRNIISKTLFNEKMESAIGFLEKFSNQGYFLIDAVSYPINKIIEENKYLLKLNRNGKVDPREREGVIFCEAGDLVNTIEYWVNESDSDMNEIKILLVKVSVFNGLMFHDNPFKKLVDKKKYNVLNTDTIPYPMVPHNIKFRAKVRKYLNIKF